MIILIDNYDSFTYNLYQYIGEIDSNIEVYRNDMITSAKIKESNPTHIVINQDNHRDIFPCSAMVKARSKTINLLMHS